MPALACPPQKIRCLVPATPYDGLLVQPGCAHFLLVRSTISSLACFLQNSGFFAPATPHDEAFLQP